MKRRLALAFILGYLAACATLAALAAIAAMCHH